MPATRAGMTKGGGTLTSSAIKRGHTYLVMAVLVTAIQSTVARCDAERAMDARDPRA
jgi:hypothetical protein